MKFTNEILEKMDRKRLDVNGLYEAYYHYLFKETERRGFKSKSDAIGQCLSVWDFHKYEKNKILDLQSVNRCNNNRFCPNCKLMDISKFIHKFKQSFLQYEKIGYKAYMLTLTIPSVSGEALRDTIGSIYEKFRKFTEKFTYSIYNKKSYSDRFFQIDGGIRVLEITYNNYAGFHPHLHCVVLVKNGVDSIYLDKKFQGKFSDKKQEYNMKSLADIQISKLWSMIWYNESLTNKNIDKIKFDVSKTYFNKKKDFKCLECDFRELDEKGIYEVFKYTFKDTDVDNFYVFKTLVNALENKRLRQGFGILFDMKCENVEIGELQELELKIEEAPTNLLIKDNLQELYKGIYKEYEKVSRFNTQIDTNVK